MVSRGGEENLVHPAEVVEIPAEWIAEVTVTDLYFVTWITLRARRLDTFDGIPGAAPGVLKLRTTSTHRGAMKALVIALEKARHAAPFRAPDPTRVLPPAAEEQTPLP